MNELMKLKIDESPCSRRDFMKDIIKGAGHIAIGSFVVSYLNACSDDSNPTSPSGSENNADIQITIDLSKSENNVLNTIGGTIAISSNALDVNGMLIIRTEQTSVTALSRTCTHQGCTIPNFQNSISTCPCHGSQYNTSGSVVNGPATQSLRKYTVSVSGNIMTITS
jgi:cytochrome b6-f complex iron-sulfur subunit